MKTLKFQKNQSFSVPLQEPNNLANHLDPSWSVDWKGCFLVDVGPFVIELCTQHNMAEGTNSLALPLRNTFFWFCYCCAVGMIRLSIFDWFLIDLGGGKSQKKTIKKGINIEYDFGWIWNGSWSDFGAILSPSWAQVGTKICKMGFQDDVEKSDANQPCRKRQLTMRDRVPGP